MVPRTKTRTRRSMMITIAAIATIVSLFCVEALSAGPIAGTTTVVTDSPPLVDVPVWSMATLNDDGEDGDGDGDRATTNMNLLTYATPVAIRPNRMYALGLFKQTKSRDNFLREKTCILQLLSASNEQHIECIRLLGGKSGANVSKEEEFASLGIELQELASDDDNDDAESTPTDELPKVLPGCVRYLQLTMVGDEVTEYDGGENCHDVVICKVDKMWTSSPLASDSGEAQSGGNDHLSTGMLRELGLITEQGRIAPLPEEE